MHHHARLGFKMALFKICKAGRGENTSANSCCNAATSSLWPVCDGYHNAWMVEFGTSGRNSSLSHDNLPKVCSFALRSRKYRVSSFARLGCSLQFSLIGSNIPCKFLPNSSSSGENPVKTWGTSHTANNIGSNQRWNCESWCYSAAPPAHQYEGDRR